MVSGLEKEGVLKALASGTLDVIIKDKSSGLTVEVPSGCLSFNSQGILLVSKAFGSIDQSVGKEVSIHFYVNQVGYCFDSIVQDSSMGLALVLPKEIERVRSSSIIEVQSFRARLLYLDENGKPVVIPCNVPESYSLLSKPSLTSIPLELQPECKKLMADFINERKDGNPGLIGSGMHLIPVSYFLCDSSVKSNLKSIHGTQEPLDLIYLDGEKLMLGKRKYSQKLELESDYTLNLEVILSAFLTRSISIGCTVVDVYDTSSSVPSCYHCKITKIKTEDQRFISERMK
ncbi:MAG: hypothetical protein J6S91_11555 [Treponema sp.]|nr:hypothetical protein [Treponema sp.]